MRRTPSVSAAGPGCRISEDLISCSSPSRTAGTASQPGRAATRPGRNFLPHQEPRITSGRLSTTARGSAITRPLAAWECESSEKRSEEHTSELQSHHDLVCRLLLEKKKKQT